MLVSAELVLNGDALHDEWLLALSVGTSVKGSATRLVEVRQVLLSLQISF